MSIEEINLYMLIVIIVQTIAVLLTLFYLYLSTKSQIQNIKESTNRQVDTIKETTRLQLDNINQSTKSQIETINKSIQENLKGFQRMITQLEKTNENLYESVNKLSIIASRIVEEEKNKPKLSCSCPQFKEEILLRKGIVNEIALRLDNDGVLFAEKPTISFFIPKKLNPIKLVWGNMEKNKFLENRKNPNEYFAYLSFDTNLEWGLGFPMQIKFNPIDVGDYSIGYSSQCRAYPPFTSSLPVKVVA